MVLRSRYAHVHFYHLYANIANLSLHQVQILAPLPLLLLRNVVRFRAAAAAEAVVWRGMHGLFPLHVRAKYVRAARAAGKRASSFGR